MCIRDSSQGVGLRVIKGNRQGFSFSSDFRSTALDKMVDVYKRQVLCLLGYAMAGASGLRRSGQDMFAVATMFCNIGFMGIPLIEAMFPEMCIRDRSKMVQYPTA